MLRALHESGARADFVVGASVGAINAAHFAADPTLDGIHRLESIWRKVTRANIFPAHPARGLLALLGARDSLVSPAPLRRLLEREFADQKLESTAIPCHVVATDLVGGQEVLLSTGSIVDALLASSAIPGVFPPVRLQGRVLIDGGIANNTPIIAAVALKADRVIVLPTGFSCRIEKAPRDAMSVALQALNLLIARQLIQDVEQAGSDVELRVVPPLCPLARTAYDFSGTAALIERSATSTSEWLKAGGLEHSGIPGALTPHDHSAGPDDR